MENIILIDDCQEVSLLTKRLLKDYNVYNASTIKEAKDLCDNLEVSLFIIDVNLPDGSGFDFCMQLTNMPKFEATPKVFLSGEGDVSKKVYGFSCGADDYITKPFTQQELLARINARLRRTKKNESELMYNFEFDQAFQRCFLLKNDQKNDLGLTPTEFRLFYSLVKNANTPLSRRELVKTIWNTGGVNIEKRGIDSHISHLRKKLKHCGARVVSIYGQGYAYQASKTGPQLC